MFLKVNINKEEITIVYCQGDETLTWLVKTSLARYYIFPTCANKSAHLLKECVEICKLDNTLLVKDHRLISTCLTDGEDIKLMIMPEAFDFHGLIKKELQYVDGDSLTCEKVMELGFGKSYLKLTEESVIKVSKAREFVENDVLKNSKVVYGINTGFGRFANTLISEDDLELLQKNLILSHSAGVGEPLTPERTRRLLALRINTLAKGYSGISLPVLYQYIDAFNASCLSRIPEKGTVGASGDLAPLAHIAYGLMGYGLMWNSNNNAFQEASKVLKEYGLKPIKLAAKEGLALINGTQLITALGVEALIRAESICREADVITCLTLEALKGTTKAFDADLHDLRPHPGQIRVASRLRSLLDSEIYPSQISESHRNCSSVQDAYTLRCCPQVHGITNDTLAFVRKIIETEINSATDNPIIFSERREVISGGNFHGEYPAKAMDYLAIAIHEIGSISERRIDKLINPSYSNLPAFLTNHGGLNSGFMMAHCTAAALVSENKCLCHPASVDSQTTSAGTEDHVSMGGWAARKALLIVENVENVIAIELLCACQGIEFHRPLKTTEPLEAVHQLLRSSVKQWDVDRYMASDIDAASDLIRNQMLWKTVTPFLGVEKLTDINGNIV